MKKLIVLILAASFILMSCAQPASPASDDFNCDSDDNNSLVPVVVNQEQSRWVAAQQDENPDNGFVSTSFVYYPKGWTFPSYLNDSKLYSSGKLKLDLVATLTASNVTDETTIFRNTDDHSAYTQLNKYKLLISKNVTEEEFLLCKGVGFNIYAGTDAHYTPALYKVKKINGKWCISQKQIVEDTVQIYH